MRGEKLAIAIARHALVPAVLIFAALIAVPSGFAKRKKAPPPPPDVSDQVLTLGRKLYGTAIDDAQPITDEIEKLVLADLDTWSANRTPSDIEMRRELERVFSKLHYPLVGEPAVLNAPWNGRTVLLAGYTLGWSDTNKVNVLAIFESADGKTHRVTETAFVPHTDLHYATLASGRQATADFRFIVYGNRLGKSQLRLTAVLYNFDGHSLKKLWEVDDAYDGRMTVASTAVTLRYLKENEYVEAETYHRKPPRYEAIYQITPDGLALLSDHEIPF
jgi:hypothetical protein